MHDAAQHLPVGHFGRRDARELVGGREKAGVAHAERPEDFLRRIFIEAPTAREADEFAEDDEVDVGVNERAARHAAELFLRRKIDACRVARPRGLDVEIGAQAGHVREQVAERDGFLAVLREGGEVVRDRSIEIEFAALDELHDGRSGRDDFGHGSGVVDGVVADGLGRRDKRALAVGLAVDLPLAFEPQDAAGSLFRRDGVGYGGIDRGKFFRFERRARRRLDGNRHAAREREQATRDRQAQGLTDFQVKWEEWEVDHSRLRM